MIEYTLTKVIDVGDWNRVVQETYGRPYNFQQQEGCQARGTVDIIIPSGQDFDSEMNDTIPEKVNGEIMGVKFKAWLARDPKMNVFREGYENELFWERNFYPHIQTIADDLHNKGLLEAGTYSIDIDW